MPQINIEFEGVDYDIFYNYTPAEEPDEHSPGCSPKIEINQIMLGPSDFTEYMEADFEKLEKIIYNEIER